MKRDLKPLCYELSKLDLSEGDVVVIRLKDHLDAATIEELRELAQRLLPEGRRVIVLANDVELNKLGEAEVRALAVPSFVERVEARDEWLRKQLDGLIEDAEAVVAATGLALARSVLGNARDARSALEERT